MVEFLFLAVGKTRLVHVFILFQLLLLLLLLSFFLSFLGRKSREQDGITKTKTRSENQNNQEEKKKREYRDGSVKMRIQKVKRGSCV